ncbi:MAG TPA: MgtC/SapB family protein [Thermoanaerobaculia bacterium]|nr:MgtC/SapB family protein [Thermoanaerobaculia bacterium]
MSGLEEIAVKLGLSAALSGVIGAEREWTGKAAGLRTHMLITIGATLLTHISHFTAGGAPWDGGRIAAQIVSGIGFIGAGTILQARGAVHGLTTAAGLWASAAMGIAVGGGFFKEAALTGGVLLVILAALPRLEHRLLRRHVQTVELRLHPGQKVAQVMDLLEEAAVLAETVNVARHPGQRPTVTICFRGSPENGQRLVQLATLRGFDACVEPTAPPPQPPSSAPKP